MTAFFITAAEHDKRVTELLLANNLDVERRRVAERELAEIKEIIADPIAVWVNMLSGGIAKPQAMALLETRDSELRAEVDSLRKALIACGRNVGGLLADEVSTDFLLLVPEEVRLVVERLRAAARQLAELQTLARSLAAVEGRIEGRVLSGTKINAVRAALDRIAAIEDVQP